MMYNDSYRNKNDLEAVKVFKLKFETVVTLRGTKTVNQTAAASLDRFIEQQE